MSHLLRKNRPRATSHMSQEPWPCNGEDPRLSSKGRTMGVGKAISCSHMPSSIVWSENGPCCGTIAYFVGGKRGEELVQYNMFQILSLWEIYLVVFVCLGICCGICLAIRPEIFPARIIIWNNHGLPEFALGPPLGGGPDKFFGRPWNLIHSPPCRTPCRLFIHEIFFGSLGLHLRVWSELGRCIFWKHWAEITVWSELAPKTFFGPKVFMQNEIQIFHRCIGGPIIKPHSPWTTSKTRKHVC